MTTKTFQMETLTCPSCVAKIEGMLKRTKGVEESEVLFNASKVKVTFDESVISAETIQENIEKLGFEVLGVK
ncbi:MAG: heavy-metal-associated domain-containing protein [Firmicutes bacterium]|nr:heavy-metal-associated domain-containing protein [Bacillota bacterium]